MALHHRLIARAARLYWRVLRPRTLGVRAVVIDQHERVALVRHTYSDRWYLPGGGVKKGESFDAALLREIREEVGLTTVTIDRVLGAYHSPAQGKDDHVVIFVVRVETDPDLPLNPSDPIEIEAARWFPIEALPRSISGASYRRIAEYRSGATNWGGW